MIKLRAVSLTGLDVNDPFCLMTCGREQVQLGIGDGQEVYISEENSTLLKVEIHETVPLRPSIVATGQAQLASVIKHAGVNKVYVQLDGGASKASLKLLVSCHSKKDALSIQVESVKALAWTPTTESRILVTIGVGRGKHELSLVKHCGRNESKPVFKIDHNVTFKEASESKKITLQVKLDDCTGALSTSVAGVQDGFYYLLDGNGRIVYQVRLLFKWLSGEHQEEDATSSAISPPNFEEINKSKGSHLKDDATAKLHEIETLREEETKEHELSLNAIICENSKAFDHSQNIVEREEWYNACDKATESFNEYLEQVEARHVSKHEATRQRLKRLTKELKCRAGQNHALQEQLARKDAIISNLDSMLKAAKEENIDLRRTIKVLAPSSNRLEYTVYTACENSSSNVPAIYPQSEHNAQTLGSTGNPDKKIERREVRCSIM